MEEMERKEKVTLASFFFLFSPSLDSPSFLLPFPLLQIICSGECERRREEEKGEKAVAATEKKWKKKPEGKKRRRRRKKKRLLAMDAREGRKKRVVLSDKTLGLTPQAQGGLPFSSSFSFFSFCPLFALPTPLLFSCSFCT